MERKFRYEIKHRFFDSPNFSLCSDGEEVVIAKIDTIESAQIFAEALVLELVNYLLPYPLDKLIDLDDPCVSLLVKNNEYIIGYQELTAAIVTIEQICPECGCNPKDEPYCMDATHCPECGHIFKEDV